MRAKPSVVVALCAVLLSAPGWAQQEHDPPREPALPAGLAAPEEPELPPGLGEREPEEQEPRSERKPLAERLPAGLHGFAEARVGPRIHDDPSHSEELTLGEVRLQVEYARAWKRVALDVKGDLALDAVVEEVDPDLRQLRLTFRPAERLDLQVGRQVMTWGTGDLLFINDLFPKDWRSFFIGRDEEYLKAPADALRIGWFAKAISLDLVYTPELEPDRFIRGERISFRDPASGGPRGDDRPLQVSVPDDAFRDDEIAARVYRNLGSYELAGYGYRGFWNSPAGFDPQTMRATFPALDVWGASLRGPLGRGIANVEIGYLDSRDDRDGRDPFVDNGEARLLVGYELELARELTGGFQYYLEHVLDHDRYLESLAGGEPRDENRHVVTTRITKLLRRQTLIPSAFLYYSPSDRDGYLRPKLVWKRSDHQTFELGANLFFGRDRSTFFGQFEEGSNVYGSWRFGL